MDGPASTTRTVMDGSRYGSVAGPTQNSSLLTMKNKISFYDRSPASSTRTVMGGGRCSSVAGPTRNSPLLSIKKQVEMVVK